MRKTARLVLTLSLWLVVILGNLAVSVSAQTTTTGAFRIVQASPDTAAIDVVVNGKKTVTDLKYQGVSDYMSLPSGTYDIQIYPAGQSGQVAPAVDLPTFNVNNGSINTLVVTGLSKNNSLTALPFTDNNWVAVSDKAKLRFVHGTPDMAAVDISVSGLGDVFKNISFKSMSSYMEIAPGTVTLQAKLSNTNQVVLSKNLTFEGGKVYTVYATGLASQQTVGIVVSIDNTLPKMPATGLGGAAQTGQPSFSRSLWLILLVAMAIVTTAGFLKLSSKRKSGHK